MHELAVIVVLAGCGAASPAPGSGPPAGKDELVAPPHYQAMFRAGASWTYEVSAQFPKDGVRADKRFDITCRVDKRAAAKQQLASTIVCDPDVPLSHQLLVLLAGGWIATPAGLAREHAPDRVVIAAAPVTAKEPDRVVEQVGGAWCTMSTSAGEGPATCDLLCFDAEGLVAQMSTFAPGNDDDFESLVVRRAGTELPISCM